MERLNYPSEYELEEVLSNFCSSFFVKRLIQSKGIIMPNATQSLIAKEFGLMMCDYDDLITIYNEAHQKTYKNTLGGFVFKPYSEEYDLISSIEGVIHGGMFDAGIKVDSLVRVPDCEIPTYRSKIEYQRKKLGRIKFLQDEPSDFEFYIKHIGSEWLVEVDSKRSKDVSVVKEFIANNVTKTSSIIEIEDNLPTEDTITFFDTLARSGLDVKHWTFSDVTQLSFRKDKRKIDDFDDEDAEIEAKGDELIGIKKAILDGHNLRDNYFVNQSVQSGYRFTAMTYEYEKKGQPYKLQIKAEFKGSPKVFEVSVVQYAEIQGYNPEPVEVVLNKKTDLELRSLFWNNARKIYLELHSNVK